MERHIIIWAKYYFYFIFLCIIWHILINVPSSVLGYSYGDKTLLNIIIILKLNIIIFNYMMRLIDLNLQNHLKNEKN